MIEDRYDYYYFSGMNTNVNPFTMKDDELLLALNWFTNKFGAKKVRPGYTQFLDAIDDQPVRNLVYFSFPSGQKGIIRVSNKKHYKYAFSGGTWGSSILTRTVDAVEGVTIMDSLVHFTNGTDDYQTYSGTAYTDLSSVNTPQAFYVTAWNSRVYATNYRLTGGSSADYLKSRLKFSAVDWTVTYADPWNEVNIDPATSGSQGVDTGANGAESVGISVVNDRPYVYKTNGVYRFNGTGIIRMPFGESILKGSLINSKDTGADYFLTTIGMFRNDGSTVQSISFKIDNILWDTFEKLGITNPVSFAFNYHVFFYVGNIYLKRTGETIPNAMFVYNERYDEWYIWSLANNMTAFGSYVDPTSGQMVMISGDDHGITYKWDTSFTTDNGAAINYRLRTKYWDFGSPEATKTFGRYSVSADTGNEASIALAVDYTDEYKTVGMETGFLTKNLVDPKQISDFKVLSLEVFGSTKDSRAEFNGVTFKEKMQEERLESEQKQRRR